MRQAAQQYNLSRYLPKGIAKVLKGRGIVTIADLTYSAVPQKPDQRQQAIYACCRLGLKPDWLASLCETTPPETVDFAVLNGDPEWTPITPDGGGYTRKELVLLYRAIAQLGGIPYAVTRTVTAAGDTYCLWRRTLGCKQCEDHDET